MAQYDRKDHFYRQAKVAGLASRATFKLDELSQKFRLLRPGMRVLDLGCAPGGWLQTIARAVGPSGRVVGVDLEPIMITLPSTVVTLQADIEALTENPAPLIEALGGPADIVLSDLAPHTTGVKFSDAYHSYALASAAWTIAQAVLRPEGNFAVKIFEGPDVAQLRKVLANAFQRATNHIPAATRTGSREQYLVGLGYQKK
ncbi:MAG: RlmE family RNA methyltransferase [Deltaproteobacteria bacterium]|nr:RlmE family RNA methyltransferase [Deltaproteobacteria bacterium]